MKQLNVDIAIIGAGTAGMSAYRAARSHTGKLVVIESGEYGTTCARVGCMPSKLLIAAAETACVVNQAHQFGVKVAASEVDGAAVMRRVRAERDRFVGFVVHAIESWPDEHRLRGAARFTAPNVLAVGEDTLVHAGRIVIATGSSPVVPWGWKDALGDRLITNDDVFEWQDLPKSVAVVGAGVIGLELSVALAQLGVRVCLLGRHKRVGPLTDPAMVDEAMTIFSGALQFFPETEHLEVARHDNTVVLNFMAQGTRHEERADFLLVAAGRKPNVSDLCLERAGIVLHGHGSHAVNRHTGQVSDSHIFVAGDVASEIPILHEAADDGRIAGINAARFPDVRHRPRRAPLVIVFSDPQIAIAGESHRQLVERNASFEAGQASFNDQGRSRIMARNRGKIRVYAERHSGRFLGAEMLGPAAEHIGHLLAWSVQHKLSVQQMLDSPFYHPVVEEGVRTALRDLSERLSVYPHPIESCLDCRPGE